jgi:hypothetical protein
MKRHLLNVFLLLLSSFACMAVTAQNTLAPDQNPNFATSRDKYMAISDSVTRLHSTTQHEMYKAIDWLQDRKEARAERQEFRRQLRLERIRWDNDYYYNDYSFYPTYRQRYGNNNFNRYYNNAFNRRGNSFYLNPWGIGYWWR